MRSEADELNQKIENFIKEQEEKKNREAELLKTNSNLNITETQTQEVKELEKSIIFPCLPIPEENNKEVIENGNRNCCELFSENVIRTFEENRNTESNTEVDSEIEELTEIVRKSNNEQKSRMKVILLQGTKILNLSTFFFSGAILLGMLVIQTIFLILNKLYSVTIKTK